MEIYKLICEAIMLHPTEYIDLFNRSAVEIPEVKIACDTGNIKELLNIFYTHNFDLEDFWGSVKTYFVENGLNKKYPNAFNEILNQNANV